MCYQWSYCSLGLSHRYISCKNNMKIPCVKNSNSFLFSVLFQYSIQWKFAVQTWKMPNGSEMTFIHAHNYDLFFSVLMWRMGRHQTVAPWMARVPRRAWCCKICHSGVSLSSTDQTRTSNFHQNHSPEIHPLPVNCEYSFIIYFVFVSL